MQTIILCTTNKGKVKEINEILPQDDPIVFKTIDQVYQGNFEVDETGKTFYENALLKAKAGAVLTKEFCLADDSGIEIEALGGKPGIYSARYLKDHKLDDILQELKGKTNRRCRFVCCLVLVDGEGKEIHHIEEYCYGNIANESKGTNGFGYDPIVIPDEYSSENLTVAELDSSIKNKISHRAKALSMLISKINQ